MQIEGVVLPCDIIVANVCLRRDQFPTITSPSFDCFLHDEAEILIERTAFICCVELQSLNATTLSGHDRVFHQPPCEPLPPVFRPCENHANPCQTRAIG